MANDTRDQCTALRRAGAGVPEPLGTYRYRPNWVLGRLGAALLLLAAPVLALAAPALGIGFATVLVSEVIGVLLAGVIWAVAIRPRLLVTSDGVTVVNAIRTSVFRWNDIGRFDCQQCLLVIPKDAEPVPVSALPATGLRRVIAGTPGPVDQLASRLNHYLTHNDPARYIPRTSIETPRGRRDIQALAALVSVGAVAVGIARAIVAAHS